MSIHGDTVGMCLMQQRGSEAKPSLPSKQWPLLFDEGGEVVKMDEAEDWASMGQSLGFT